MDDLCLSVEVKAALVNIKRDIQVSAHNGIVYINTTILESKEIALEQNIRSVVEKLPDVKDVKINLTSIPAYVHNGIGP